MSFFRWSWNTTFSDLWRNDWA